jgi:hypothetical protein
MVAMTEHLLLLLEVLWQLSLLRALKGLDEGLAEWLEY